MTPFVPRMNEKQDAPPCSFFPAVFDRPSEPALVMIRRLGCNCVKRRCAHVLACAWGLFLRISPPHKMCCLAARRTHRRMPAPVVLERESRCALPSVQPYPQTPAPSTVWITPPGAQSQKRPPRCRTPADPAWGQPVIGAVSSEPWCWHLLPRSLIYRSYQAGVHEPRLGIVAEASGTSHQSFWDGTLGGRVGSAPLWHQRHVLPARLGT